MASKVIGLRHRHSSRTLEPSHCRRTPAVQRTVRPHSFPSGRKPLQSIKPAACWYKSVFTLRCSELWTVVTSHTALCCISYLLFLLLIYFLILLYFSARDIQDTSISFALIVHGFLLINSFQASSPKILNSSQFMSLMTDDFLKVIHLETSFKIHGTLQNHIVVFQIPF